MPAARGPICPIICPLTRPCRPRVAVLAVAAAAMVCSGSRGTPAPSPLARLADAGRAAVPVAVGPNASLRVRAAAESLAAYLGRIAGARFDAGLVQADG